MVKPKDSVFGFRKLPASHQQKIGDVLFVPAPPTKASLTTTGELKRAL